MKTEKRIVFFSTLAFLVFIIVLLSNCAQKQPIIPVTNNGSEPKSSLSIEPVDYTPEEREELVVDEIFYYNELLKMWEDDEAQDNSSS